MWILYALKHGVTATIFTLSLRLLADRLCLTTMSNNLLSSKKSTWVMHKNIHLNRQLANWKYFFRAAFLLANWLAPQTRTEEVWPGQTCHRVKEMVSPSLALHIFIFLLPFLFTSFYSPASFVTVSHKTSCRGAKGVNSREELLISKVRVLQILMLSNLRLLQFCVLSNLFTVLGIVFRDWNMVVMLLGFQFLLVEALDCVMELGLGIRSISFNWFMNWFCRYLKESEEKKNAYHLLFCLWFFHVN